MSNTINIGGIEVSKFYLGGSSDVKIYLGSTKLYPHSQSYDVCYAVVDDISTYTARTYTDVYDSTADKWYKLNNLNQYEEYGVYGSGRTITTYDGKLTVDDGYEYQYSGNSWVNLGEVSGSSRVPAGYTEVEYIENKNAAYIDTGFKPNQDTRITATMQAVSNTSYGRLFGCGGYDKVNAMQIDYENGSTGTLHISWGANPGWTNYSSCVGDYNVHTYDWDKNVFYRDKGETNQFSASTNYSNFQCQQNLSVFMALQSSGPDSGGAVWLGKMYDFKVYDNGTLIRDLVPSKRDSDSKYGAYDIVNDVFYPSPSSTYSLTGGSATTEVVYPVYYDDKSEPLDNLTFNTMEDALDYAYNNCVYDGMKAIIDGERYYFDSQDGWTKMLEYYKFEDVTPNQASGWTISGSATYNPDQTYYDDFDLETTSTIHSYKIAKVTIYGYDHFTYYLRTTGYSTYCYAVATNVDEVSTPPSTMSYNSSSAITNTYNWNKSPKSAVNLSNYRRVTYNNLDKTVEHTFYVYFYGRTLSSYVGNATILIPKEQTNENWEQVTFSASSNVASTQKNLIIDNNNSTSGGTQYWYYRWMIGLPSGSHTSYTNFSKYDYCPNVTSSTFTSVAGEQRQVNFTYDYATDKSLQFRLVDTSGNTLEPTNTVYYSLYRDNPCNVTSLLSNLTFPRSETVKVGGSFYFANSSNRQHIYGYTAPILGVRYYSDDYNSTFDITYTKLSEEAVTITYTTYDPNDVETPSFKTDITYPYSGGTTSSTTLTSYAVPYTYSYEVSQTSDKFSADKQSYTANQAARTINFVLYPNNREFASVADLEAYGYPWEGMIAYVGTDKYVYQNGEWVYNPSRLPGGYTEVEYIQNTGTSTINTNFIPNTNTRVVCEMECTNTSKNYPRLFGAGAWNGNNGINIAYQNDGGSKNIHIGWFGSTSWSYYTSATIDTNKHTYDLNKNEFYRDNTFVGSTTYSSTITASYPLGIFCYINGSTPGSSSYWGQEHFVGKMYSCQIYDNGTQVRDLVPCIRDNDDTVGVYDIVNDVFYPPMQSQYPFVAGDPV